jgi:hypothetical protein
MSVDRAMHKCAALSRPESFKPFESMQQVVVATQGNSPIFRPVFREFKNPNTRRRRPSSYDQGAIALPPALSPYDGGAIRRF